MKKYVIAIDGPAASGKSTTAKLLAKKLKYVYIDTGAMYRACALETILKNISLKDEKSLQIMLDSIRIDILYSDKGNILLLNGDDVTKRIREADITKLSSEIAVIGIVRTKMVDLQREIGKNGGVIMDGRDIGTVVFPQADYKFFIVADVEVRAYRRWIEAKEKGEILILSDVEKELNWRDQNDSNREISPLKKADDALEIDTTNLSVTEQVELIGKAIERGKNAEIL
ncbi:MAG: (d)CMP kinase [Candidatus Cloacimonetes bacterium]|nr:(d)CMP kinase [Candidatus Cloacimonadota bacterium]